MLVQLILCGPITSHSDICIHVGVSCQQVLLLVLFINSAVHISAYGSHRTCSSSTCVHSHAFFLIIIITLIHVHVCAINAIIIMLANLVESKVHHHLWTADHTFQVRVIHSLDLDKLQGSGHDSNVCIIIIHVGT